MTDDARAVPYVSARVTTQQRVSLDSGWSYAVLASTATGAPSTWPAVELAPAPVPGTVAAAWRQAGRDVYVEGPKLDAHDFAYACSFAAPTCTPGDRVMLSFEGLATFCEIWLNDHLLHTSQSMFVPCTLDVTDRLRADNALQLRFRSLDAVLAQRRPRAKHRTKLVDHPQLRFVRTSLLGRMPGWSPPVHAVGPFRDITLIVQRGIELKASRVNARVNGNDGQLDVRVQLGKAPITDARLQVGDASVSLPVTAVDGGFVIEGTLRIPDVKLWWPHTHGEQPLYAAALRVTQAGQEHAIDLGRVGFRTVDLECTGDQFALRINGVPVFCRGACWTTLDLVTLDGTTDAYASELRAVRDAGMNMLRVGGTMFYENDTFHRTCDELGIMVWQDFMFANMDYPIDDEAFSASVHAEVEAFFERTASSVSLTMLCGGSEVEQQISMLGLPREQWQGRLFYEVLPALRARLRSDVPYWPGSPSGGALPFGANSGVTHYYGVGAYLRPLEDARRAEVKFAAESLAFANVPAAETLALVHEEPHAVLHHPRWKQRVPRDAGSSWDFEDVREHYLRTLFNVDPALLRYTDPERYLALSRVVTGEVMAATFAEWRRERSTCSGAMVWFYRDLWPGAGWGVVDSTGRPKAAFHYLKRAFANVVVFLSDEGLNGLHAHVVNESAQALHAKLDITFHKDGERAVIANATQVIELTPHSQCELTVSALLPWFLDTTYAYRFGPPSHDLCVATLTDARDAKVLGDAFHMPLGLSTARSTDLGLSATAAIDGDGSYLLTLASQRFAYAVAIDCPGYVAENDFVNVPPSAARTLRLRPTAGARALSGYVSALNATQPVKIIVAPNDSASRAGQ